MATLPKTHLTVEEYLALDEASDVKLEYFAGEVYAMAGALRPHNVIAGNTYASLHQQLRGRNCEVYLSDQLVRTGDGLFTYPDLSVACPPAFLEKTERTLLNPVLIVEVLSNSTELYDRTAKFEHYWTIDSLQEYLMLSSGHMRADLFVRHSNGRWILAASAKPDDVIELTSCECRLRMADLYEKIELPPAPQAT